MWLRILIFIKTDSVNNMDKTEKWLNTNWIMTFEEIIIEKHNSFTNNKLEKFPLGA